MVTNKKVTGNVNNVNQMKKFTPGDIVWIRPRSGSWWPAQIVDEERVILKPKKKFKDGVLVRMYGCYEYLYVDPVTCNAEFEKILKQDNLTPREAFLKAIDEDLSRIRPGSKSKRKATDSKEGTAKKPKKDGAKAEKPKKDGAKAKKPKKDGAKEKVAGNKKDEAKVEKPKKDGAKEKVVGNKKDGAKVEKPKKDGAKAESTPVGKNTKPKKPKVEESAGMLTPEPSERRIKVMQRMGLIAPVGSPYQASGAAMSSLKKK